MSDILDTYEVDAVDAPEVTAKHNTLMPFVCIVLIGVSIFLLVYTAYSYLERQAMSNHIVAIQNNLQKIQSDNKELQEKNQRLQLCVEADAPSRLDAAAKAGLTTDPSWCVQNIIERGGDGSVFVLMEASTRQDKPGTPSGFSWHSATEEALNAAKSRRTPPDE